MAFKIDTAHSQVNFTVRHMMISRVRGSFDTFDGTVNLDEQSPANTSVDVRIDAASINTNDANRDAHLKSPDFLNAEQFPHVIFKGTRVEVINDERARLHGELTIRDITHPVVLDVEYNGMAKSPWGTTSYGFHGVTKINRKDWNLTWNQTLETGGVLVGDEINIEIELELVKHEEEGEKLAREEAESMERSK